MKRTRGLTFIIAFLLSVVVGLALILCLPLKVWSRLLIAILYLPVMGYLLLMYSFVVVGSVYNAWP